MTPFALRDDEWALLERVPVQDLVELAVDLDVVLPSEVDRRALIDRCVPLVVERGLASGLPFSKYDEADLEALAPHELAALGRIQGLTGAATPREVIRVGQRVYRAREKQRKGLDPLAYMIPILLRPIVRHALERGLGAGSA